MALVPENHPQRLLMGLPVTHDALSVWLAESPVAAPLRAVCDQECPETRAACLAAAYAALNDHGAVLTLGSPVETLIPAERFLNSTRGRQTVVRRILLSTSPRGRALLIDRARSQDLCFGAYLSSEQQRYRHVRTGAENGTADPSD